MQAISANKLDKHVIALLPATDNRPSGNAYAPGDVITMHDGTTVEVLNTDAEGRMVLADALSFAKKYKPELVIDLATLTGAVVVALSDVYAGLMYNSTEIASKIEEAGEETQISRPRLQRRQSSEQVLGRADWTQNKCHQVY